MSYVILYSLIASFLPWRSAEDVIGVNDGSRANRIIQQQVYTRSGSPSCHSVKDGIIPGYLRYSHSHSKSASNEMPVVSVQQTITQISDK